MTSLTLEPSAIVTGGSAGIGKAVAECLASEGYQLTLVARGSEQLDSVANDLQARFDVRVETVCGDIGDESLLALLVEQHRSAFGGLDVLVNNAGATGGSPIGNIGTAELDEHLRINLRSVVILTNQCIPLLLDTAGRRGRARVFNVASMLGLTSAPSRSVYAAMKHGVVGFNKSINTEFSTRGLTATALCPSYVATDRVANLKVSIPPESLVKPRDLAEAVRFCLRLSPACHVPELSLVRADDAFGVPVRQDEGSLP